jgi:hypothetical protein
VTNKGNTWITAVVVLILTAAIFCFGYTMRGVWNPAPVPVHDTIYVIDTIEHHITTHYPYYIEKIDTFIIRDTITEVVDTAKILSLYYAFHVYSRAWEDSLLKVTLRDTISENRYFGSDFNYKILRPQEIIQNTTINYNYSKYLYLGGSVTLPNAEWSSLAVYFAFKRGLAGVGYIPYQRGISVTGAIRIGKFK